MMAYFLHGIGFCATPTVHQFPMALTSRRQNQKRLAMELCIFVNAFVSTAKPEETSDCSLPHIDPLDGETRREELPMVGFVGLSPTQRPWILRRSSLL